MYLLGRAGGGTGTFDDTLARLGPAVAVCTAFTLVPDLVIGALLNFGLMAPEDWLYGVTHPTLTLALVWTYLLAYLVAFLVAFPLVVRRVHRLRWPVALAVGWACFAVYQGFLLVFVR
jgi:peptidoglycan/LPS O-acetylase OafA/YrhL